MTIQLSQCLVSKILKDTTKKNRSNISTAGSNFILNKHMGVVGLYDDGSPIIE